LRSPGSECHHRPKTFTQPSISHPLARLDTISRERAHPPAFDEGVPLKALAAQAGISLAYGLQVALSSRSGVAALADRRSVRRSQRRTPTESAATPAGCLDLRHQRCRSAHRQGSLVRPSPPLVGLMKGLGGLGTPEELDPKRLVRRLPVGAPRGHDPCRHFKTAARFERVRPPGHHRRHVVKGSSRGCPLRKVTLSPIDRRHPPGYVEVLADEQKATTVGFLARCVGCFSEQGIHCRRILFGQRPLPIARMDCGEKACRAWIETIRTKALHPQTNGKPTVSSKPSCRMGLL